jgi:apolipoprotein N-acyltransferase
MPDALPYRNPRDEPRPPTVLSVFLGVVFCLLAVGATGLVGMTLLGLGIMQWELNDHAGWWSFVFFFVIATLGCALINWLLISLAAKRFRRTKPPLP